MLQVSHCLMPVTRKLVDDVGPFNAGNSFFRKRVETAWSAEPTIASA